MPQGSNARKSSSSKKSRAPAHQNQFAFQHNPKSKLTEQILNSPISHVCQRCHDKLEWRKKYRKYKPRSQPGTCNLCRKRNVLAAYHTICTSCTVSDRARRAVVMQLGRDSSDSDVLVESTASMTVNDKEETSQPQLPHRACAMCVKEPALPDEPNEAETVDDLLARENRRVKLRERKTLERKLARQQQEAKEAAKQARRAERGEEEDEGSEAQAKSPGNEADKHDLSDSDVQSEDDDDDEEKDPFLVAVGGADQLLTGEAYQKMLLAKQNPKI